MTDPRCQSARRPIRKSPTGALCAEPFRLKFRNPFSDWRHAISCALFPLVVGVLFAPVAAAEAPGLAPISLAQSVDQAIAQNPALKAARLDVDASRQVVRQAQAPRLPHVGVELAGERGDEPGYVFSRMIQQGHIDMKFLLNPSLLANPPALNNFRARAGFSWLVYDGGTVKAASSQAKAGVQAAEAGVKAEADALAAEVADAYLCIVRLKSQGAVLDKAAEALEALRKRSSDLLDQGMVVRSDAMQVDVRRAEVERERIALENGLTVARFNLARLMGDPGVLPDAADALKPFHPLAVASLNDQVATARSVNPNLNRLACAVKAAEHQVDRCRSDYRPKALVGAGYEGNSNFDGAGAHGYVAAVGVKWDVFDGFARESRLAEARIRQTQAVERLREGETLVSLAVRRAWYDLDTAARQVAVAEKAAAQARESYRIVTDRYENGLTTVDDLLGAEAALRKADSDRVAAAADYAVRYVRLGQATGDALTAVQTIQREFLP